MNHFMPRESGRDDCTGNTTERTTRRDWLRSAAVGTAAGVLTMCESSTARGEEIPATGTAVPGLESFDRLMQSFLQEHQVTGGSIAVARNQRLMYARGFGWANRETQQTVEPTSLFRIASISKPITAVAVLQLVEQAKLKLTDKLTAVLSLKDVTDVRWNDITIEHLLHHTAGFDREQSFDPMFRSVEIAQHFRTKSPATSAQIVAYMQSQPLDFTPGERYAYSNFGYCLLGRVIETLTRSSYAEAVQASLLKPLKIDRMQIGQTLKTARDEVKYYAPADHNGPAVIGNVGQPVAAPYGRWYLEGMDSHGGWIASATDLVKFAAAFDRPQTCPVLKPDSIQTMFAPPDGSIGHESNGNVKAVYYGCGWQVRPVDRRRGTANTWHNGALDGTSTILVRRHDGMVWGVLFNGRSTPDGKALSSEIDGLVHRAADAVTHWPMGTALW